MKKKIYFLPDLTSFNVKTNAKIKRKLQITKDTYFLRFLEML